jgi:parallel beta-helix repeat protein
VYGPLNGTTIEFHINPAGALDKDGNQLSFQAVKNAIQRAVNTWNDVPHSYATFTVSDVEYTGSRNNSDHVSTITFEPFGTGTEIWELATGACYTNHNYSELTVIHVVDIAFCNGTIMGDDWRPLRWNTDSTYPSTYPLYPCPYPPSMTGIDPSPDIGPIDLEDVAVHELGHGVGLSDRDRNYYSMQATHYELAEWWKKTWRRSLEVGDKAGKIYQDPDFPGSATQANSKVLLSSRATTTLNGAFTVPSGYTLYSEGGKTLSFTNGAALVINGTFTPVDVSSSTPVTLNFVSPNSSTQNGIKFNSGSSGTISYCQIRNAYRGVYENNVSVNIANSAISNCTDGIYLYSSSPSIQNCNLHHNTNSGITLLYSTATLQNGNYIQNNAYGLFCSSNAYPVIGNGSGTPGNFIRDNSYGVFCYNYGIPKIGDPSGYGGYNNLVNTSYNVYNTTGLIVYARNNWWGSTNPGNFKIMGNVSYSPYLSSALTIPTPPLSKASGNLVALDGDIPLLSELDKAYQLLAGNDPEAARTVCLNLINNYPDYSVAGNALLLLQETFAESERGTVQDIYKSLFDNKSKKELYAMAGLLLAELDKENKLERIDRVIKSYDGEPIVELALFDKFVYYYFELSDMKNAVAVSKELDEQFPDSYAAIEAHIMLGDEGYDGKLLERTRQPLTKAETIALPESFAVYANYPNPFNPETHIKFDIPEADHVLIEILDIQGRRVNTLVNRQYEAGFHSVTWRGDTAAGARAASGMYLYRLRYRDQVRTCKMLQIK